MSEVLDNKGTIVIESKIKIASGEIVTLLFDSTDKKNSVTNEIQNNFRGKFAFIPSRASSFPWLNVKENVKFFSDLSDDRISKIINLVGLEGYQDHFPHNKSIGFRFRISLARALASNAEFILIDNPTLELGKKRKTELLSIIRRGAKESNKGILLLGYSISEAIRVSDRVVFYTNSLIEKKIFINENDRNLLEKIEVDDFFSSDELSEVL